MDLFTLAGLLTSLLLIVGSLLAGGGAASLLHVPSLLILTSGIVAAVLLQFKATDCRQALRSALRSLRGQLPDDDSVVTRFRSIATSLRRGGRAALEELLHTEQDEFMRRGMELTLEEADQAQIQAALDQELKRAETQLRCSQRLFEVMGAAAPAWGLIGSLLGLLQLLRGLDDPQQIGTGLALALLTTLYGTIFSHLICQPLAGRLATQHDRELSVRGLMREGFLTLREESSPVMVEERLRLWVPPGSRRAA